MILALFLMMSEATLAVGHRGKDVSEKVQAKKEELQAKAVDRLRSIGNKMIDQRLTVLNKAIERVNKATRVSEGERSAIIAELNGHIDTLTTLKATIDAETDVDNLKALIKSIVNDHRIYVVVLPRTRGELAAGRANAVLVRLNALSGKMTRWMDAAKARGKDVSQVEALYQDFQARIADADSQVDAAMSHFQSMQPAADTSAAKSHLESGKAAMHTARQDLKTAQQDLRKIIVQFKGLRLGTIKNGTETVE